MELESPVQIPDRMFFKIGEVASIVGVRAYVLRYWESEFSVLNPNKTNSQQRLYSRVDVETALLIKHLLYDLKFSIAGARKRLNEMRRHGELKEARKLKIAIDQQEWESRELAIAEARAELKQLIELCDRT
ncbi:MAG: MerR family transcriptional regulator [Bacteriovoracia bacterium]